LRPGSPDVAAFPRAEWLAAARRALAVAPAETLGYSDPRGLRELREALAGYLARARGVRVTAERIVVTSGFTQAFGLLCQVLRARGATTIAVESYGAADHRQIAAACGLSITTLHVDHQGAVVDELGQADAALLTPAHQFPVGVALAPERRASAITWAARTGGLVIEDDYDGEFRYDRQPVGALQALAPDHVVYAGTASKSLAPGLRLGWLVLPARLVAQVAEAKLCADRNSSSLDQLTLAEFITCGSYDRHIRRSRLVYRQRQERLAAAVQRDAPNIRITGIAAGLHALLELPAAWDESEIVARAPRHGLVLEGLGSYAARDGGHGPALVVGYGTPPQHAFSGAVARLTALLTDNHPL
jgi:GntR family transcriptional regulator/MocR family aminotransferase